MKKTLAIVLALVMVLCMIPAVAADTTSGFETKELSGKSYELYAASKGDVKADYTKAYNHVASGNTIELKYDYEGEIADETSRFAENAKMAEVIVKGFDAAFTAGATVTIDGKKVEAPYGFNADEDWVVFPVEMTKAGYSDTFLIQVTETNSDKTMTETAKISVKMVNTAAYKNAKTATITNIESSDEKIMSAYIVGSKIYMDWASAALSHTTWAGETVDITFGDENKKAFDVIAYAYDANDYRRINGGAKEEKLGSDSAATYAVIPASANGTKVTFTVETAAALYETKEYTIVVRENIKPVDPKGIYFAEPTKTIAMGESFEPVVLAVSNGAKVKVDAINYGTNTSKEVIDIDGKTVIGTREGVAYITAEYTPFMGTKYESSSMKVVVTAGESIPPVVKTETYYVTCRNLNVRKGPGTSYAKAGMIHRGDAVEVVETANGWAKLADGTYVCAKYIAK